MTIFSAILSTVLMLIVVSIFVAFILISHAIRYSSEAFQGRSPQKVRTRSESLSTVKARQDIAS